MEGDIVAAIPRMGPLAQRLASLAPVSKAHLRRIMVEKIPELLAELTSTATKITVWITCSPFAEGRHAHNRPSGRPQPTREGKPLDFV